jgi:hypothetical protein
VAQLAARHPVPFAHESHQFFIMPDHPIVHEPMQLKVQTISGRNAWHAVKQAQKRAERVSAALVRVNCLDPTLAAELSDLADLIGHPAQRGGSELQCWPASAESSRDLEQAGVR